MKSEKFSGSIYDGQPILSKDGIMYFACCDCGLTHMIIGTVINKIDVEFRFFRDNQRSYHRRKNEKYPYVSKKPKKKK